MGKSIRLKKEYQQLQEEQLKLLNEHPYSKVIYFIQEDNGSVIDIMKISEIDNMYESIGELVDLLNKQRNIITGLKVTRRRMSSDIRAKNKEISKLKMKINKQIK